MAACTLTLALGACGQPAPQGTGQAVVAASGSSAPLRVSNSGQPFRMDQGVAARRVADATCAAMGKRLRPGLYDRFEAGAWVYPGGCA